jgi:hypothetical protein
MKKRIGFIAAGAAAVGMLVAGLIPTQADAAAPIEKYTIVCLQAPGGRPAPFPPPNDTGYFINCTAPLVGDNNLTLNPDTDLILGYRKPKGPNVQVLVTSNGVVNDHTFGFPISLLPLGVGLPCAAQHTQGTGNFASWTPGPGFELSFPFSDFCFDTTFVVFPDGTGGLVCFFDCIYAGKYINKQRGFAVFPNFNGPIFSQVGKSGPVKVKVSG